MAAINPIGKGKIAAAKKQYVPIPARKWVLSRKKESTSFLKKRSKKLLLAVADSSSARALKTKVFLLLFFQKKKSLLFLKKKKQKDFNFWCGRTMGARRSSRASEKACPHP